MPLNFLKNPGRALFGSAPRSAYRDQQAQFAQQMGNLSGAYQNRLAKVQESVQRFDPMYQAAIRTRLNYLQEQPFAAQEDAMRLAQASGAGAEQYGLAQSNLARMLAQRGIGGGVAAGAMANLEGARMGQRAASQYQTAMARIAARNAAQQEALGLLGGVRGMYGQEELGGLSGLQGLYGQGYQMYGDMASQEEAAKAAHQQRTLGMISQAAGLAFGNPAAMYGATRSAPQVRRTELDGSPIVARGTPGSQEWMYDQVRINGLPEQKPTRRRNFLGIGY